MHTVVSKLCKLTKMKSLFVQELFFRIFGRIFDWRLLGLDILLLLPRSLIVIAFPVSEVVFLFQRGYRDEFTM
jgi:hypothetical protein